MLKGKLFARFVLFLCAIIALTGCGGDSESNSTAPQLRSSTPVNGSWLTPSDTLEFVFDETIDAASISLSGTMAVCSQPPPRPTTP